MKNGKKRFRRGSSRTRRGGGRRFVGGAYTQKVLRGGALDKTGKAIKVGSKYTCKGTFSSPVLTITAINETKKTVDGNDEKGKKQTGYTANKCTPYVAPSASSVVDIAGKAIQLNKKYSCKGTFGSTIFTVKTIDAAKKTVSGTDDKGKAQTKFTAANCTLQAGTGAAGTGAAGTGAAGTTYGVAIKVEEKDINQAIPHLNRLTKKKVVAVYSTNLTNNQPKNRLRGGGKGATRKVHGGAVGRLTKSLVFFFDGPIDKVKLKADLAADSAANASKLFGAVDTTTVPVDPKKPAPAGVSANGITMIYVVGYKPTMGNRKPLPATITAAQKTNLEKAIQQQYGNNTAIKLGAVKKYNMELKNKITANEKLQGFGIAVSGLTAVAKLADLQASKIKDKLKTLDKAFNDAIELPTNVIGTPSALDGSTAAPPAGTTTPAGATTTPGAPTVGGPPYATAPPPAELKLLPGQPLRLNPGDYKGMLSTAKYFVYKDPFRGTQAANILVKMTPEGDYGFFRITGSADEIENGIRTLRGKVSASGFKDIIGRIKEEISDLESDFSKLGVRMTAVQEADVASPQEKDNYNKILASYTSRRQEVERDLADARTRLQKAEADFAQQQASAQQPLVQ